MMKPFSSRFTPVPLKGTSLFKPIKLGRMELQHRVVLAPLTRLRNEDFIPTPRMVEYYRQRSTRPGTFIVTEATLISPRASGAVFVPGIWTKEQIQGWSKVHEAIHANKSYVFQQIWALGRQAFPKVLKSQGLPYQGPSDGVYMDEANKKAAAEAGNPLRAVTKAEIQEYVKDFAQAAKNSIEAGADGVEIHGASGYILNQFLDPVANVRTDEYGGTIENRGRFMLELVDALIDAVGAERVGLRISPFGVYGSMLGVDDPLYLAQYAYVLGELERRAKESKRIAYVHTVEPRAMDLNTPEGEVVLENVSNDFIYSVWKGVVIRCGDYALNPDLAAKHVEMGRTMIAYGRMYISNPDLPDRLYHGQPLTEYDRGTFYAHGIEGYTDYPSYEEALAANSK